ncbi:hypothetical protein [Azospirillum melinis]
MREPIAPDITLSGGACYQEGVPARTTNIHPTRCQEPLR